MDYIKYLSDINSNFCDVSEIRTKNITNLKRIEAAYHDAIESEDYNTLINKTIYTAALITLYQPFYDGNHRTALVVCKDILNQKGYSFDFSRAMDDIKNRKPLIPILYDPDEIIKENYGLNGYIKKYQNKNKFMN